MYRLGTEAETIALLAAFHRLDRCHGEMHLLPVANSRDVHRLAAIVLQVVDDVEERAHGRAIDGNDLVPQLQPGLDGGHIGLKLGHGDRLVGHPADGAVLFRAIGLWLNLLLENLVAALDGDVDRLLGADHHLQHDVFPGRVLLAIDAHDAVALLDTGLGRWRIVQYPSDHCRLVEKHRMLVVHHEHAGEERDGQDDVHGRTGDGDHEALPARMRHEFVGRAAARFQRVLARHLDVTAQRQGADAVVGFAAAKAGQPLAEADGEDIDANAKPFGGGKVAELVHQDHDAEHHGHRNHRNDGKIP